MKDGIYNELLQLTTTRSEQGYVASLPIGIDLSKLGTAQQSGAGSVLKPSGAPKP
jgi:hypothetical protein